MSSMLVVEDDEAIAEVVAYQLTHSGHTVAVAHDGMQALERLTHDQIDLVILDLMLPRLSGLEMLRVLRRDSDTPVIILSARDGDADQVAALDLGADDYVTKPFSMRQLLARVSAVMRRAAPPESRGTSEPECDVVIDATRHEVRKRGQIIPLAPKEFELLLFLAERANRVCSRDAVLNAVWGYGYEGETRTVDVHIHWIRRKLEDDPSSPKMLVTIRQYGYKLVTQLPGQPPQIALIAAQDATPRALE